MMSVGVRVVVMGEVLSGGRGSGSGGGVEW